MHATVEKNLRAPGGRPSQIARDLASGSLVGSLAITYSYTFAALIYSGPLAAGLGAGLAAAFLGAAVTSVVVAQWSSVDRALGGLDTPVIAVVSVLAASLARDLAGTITQGQLIATVQAAILIATLLTGVGLFIVGLVRGGSWLRFVPYSVSAGFLGASGLFLITGALKVTTGAHIDILRGALALQPGEGAQLAAAAGTALLLLGTRLFRSPFLLPAVLFAVALASNIATSQLGGAAAGDAFAGWYLGGAAADGTIHPAWSLLPSNLVQWHALSTHASGMLAVAGIAILAVLLNVSGLEVIRHLNADLDNEFRVSGIANLASSILGGLPGNFSMNRSYLNVRSGAVTRLSGLVVSAICIVFLIWGHAFAPYIPRFVLGGLLIFLGVTILGESVLRPATQLSRSDRLLAITIMIVVVKFGYAAATAFGVVTACAIFAVNYSRIEVIKQRLSRRTYPSKVTRGPSQTALLIERGEAIQILRLHGYIFFGTAHRLVTQIQEIITRHRAAPVRFIILDLAMVPGFDSSAVLSFGKMRSHCEGAGVELVFSNLTRAMGIRLRNAALIEADNGRPRVFEDRDDALEWCEDAMLADCGKDLEPQFLDWLEEEVGGRATVERLLSYLERREYASGETLYRLGDPADSIEFIASGRLRIQIEQPGGRTIYLRSMTGNTVVGEMGFYRDMTRTASVIAEQPTVVYRLDRANFLEMFEKDPQANSTLNALIVRILSDRLAGANQEISAFS